MIERPNANFDGAYKRMDYITDYELCVQGCIDEYPDCSAVDFNPHDRVCALFHAEYGVGHWQRNSCCTRYEIVSCDERTYLSLISIVTMQ